jgi:hypothetical protein
VLDVVTDRTAGLGISNVPADGCAMITVAYAESDPDDATIKAEPLLAVVVTCPVALTVATEVLELDHEIGVPFESVALNWNDWRGPLRMALWSVTKVIREEGGNGAVGVTVVVGTELLPPPPPQAASSATSTLRTTSRKRSMEDLLR